MKQNTETPGGADKWSMGMKTIKVDLRRAVAGGIIAGLVILLGGWLVGRVSSWEAFQLYKIALPSTRSFCGTLFLALGNILALMLTLLSLSASLDIDIKWSHYQRVQQIAWVVTVTLITTIICYLLLNIPVAETEKNKIQWFRYVYYAVLVISSLLGGAFITIVLLLYNTVRDMIGVLKPDRSHWLRHTNETEEE